MSVVVERDAVDISGGTDRALVHTVCTRCYPEHRPGNRALCGAHLRGVAHRRRDCDCVVCAEMTPRPCPECGG